MNDPATPPQPPGFIAIRRAVADDAAAIQSMYRELIDDSCVRVLPEQIAALADTPGSFLLVAEARGLVCGTALLTICADVMYQLQPFGVVENVVVTRPMRGQGLGKRLLDEIEQLATTQDCTKLMLLSSIHRHEAHAFFNRRGFTGDTKNAFVKYRSQFSAG